MTLEDGVFRGFGSVTEHSTIRPTPMTVERKSAELGYIPDASSIAPTIAIAYGQRWPTEANSIQCVRKTCPRWSGSSCESRLRLG